MLKSKQFLKLSLLCSGLLILGLSLAQTLSASIFTLDLPGVYVSKDGTSRLRVVDAEPGSSAFPFSASVQGQSIGGTLVFPETFTFGAPAIYNVAGKRIGTFNCSPSGDLEWSLFGGPTHLVWIKQ